MSVTTESAIKAMAFLVSTGTLASGDVTHEPHWTLLVSDQFNGGGKKNARKRRRAAVLAAVAKQRDDGTLADTIACTAALFGQAPPKAELSDEQLATWVSPVVSFVLQLASIAESVPKVLETLRSGPAGTDRLVAALRWHLASDTGDAGMVGRWIENASKLTAKLTAKLRLDGGLHTEVVARVGWAIVDGLDKAGFDNTSVTWPGPVDHLCVLRVRTGLALLRTKRVQDGAVILRDTVPIMEQRGGPRSPAAVEALLGLIDGTLQLQSFKAALVTMQKLRGRFFRPNGELIDDDDVRTAWENMPQSLRAHVWLSIGRALLKGDRLREAEAAFVRTHELLPNARDDSPDTRHMRLLLLPDHSQAVGFMERYGVALRLMRQGNGLRIEQHGKHHVSLVAFITEIVIMLTMSAKQKAGRGESREALQDKARSQAVFAIVEQHPARRMAVLAGPGGIHQDQVQLCRRVMGDFLPAGKAPALPVDEPCLICDSGQAWTACCGKI